VADSACPSWCTNVDCDGNHAGEAIEAGKGMSIGPGVVASMVMRPYHDQADEVEPEIFLTENWAPSEWAFQLPAEEARRLGQALIETADMIEPQGDRSA
jgi:hypothetical protein